MLARFSFFIAAALAISDCSTARADEPIDFTSGGSFRRTLEEPVTGAWDDNLRGITLAIEQVQRVSILLDRRLDPSSGRSLRVAGESLHDCLRQLAAEADAGCTIIGNTAYLGPPETAAKLRTLVALRRQDILDKRREIPESRRTALRRPVTLRWNDLDRPADLVSRLAGEYALSVEGIDQVPHDLWAAAALPETTAIEGLTLILAQYELTFAWLKQGGGIQIEPVPGRVTMEKAHDPPRGVAAAAAIKRWKVEIPELEARIENGKIVVVGTDEQQEVVDRVRRGGSAREPKAVRAATQLKPLKDERYSGKIQNIPVSAILKDLERPERGQLTFEYDRAAFKAAGIDLDKRVTFELKNKSKIEDLLKATLDPLGVTFEIHDRTVKLKPASAKD